MLYIDLPRCDGSKNPFDFHEGYFLIKSLKVWSQFVFIGVSCHFLI